MTLAEARRVVNEHNVRTESIKQKIWKVAEQAGVNALCFMLDKSEHFHGKSPVQLLEEGEYEEVEKEIAKMEEAVKTGQPYTIIQKSHEWAGFD